MRGLAGRMSHAARCAFKRPTENREPSVPLNREKSHMHRSLPVTLGGNGPRIASDLVYEEMQSDDSEMQYVRNQEEIYGEAKNVRALLDDLVEEEATKEGRNDQKERKTEEATSEEVVEALSIFLGTLCSDIGAAKLDHLLLLIQHPAYKPELSAEKFTSATSLKQYIRTKVMDAERDYERLGFRQQIVSVPEGVRCKFYMRDPIEVLKLQLRSSRRQNTIYEYVREVNRRNERIFKHPLSGKLASEGFPKITEAIKRSTRPDVCWDTSLNNFVGAIQLYSDKSSTSLACSAMTFYPLHLTLLNFSHDLRRRLIQRGDTKVAFLPVYISSTNDRIIPDRPLKMKILHKALERSLKSIVEAAWTGFDFEDGESIPRRCFPCLGNYISDIPEGKDLTSTLHGNVTNFPCPRCLVERKELADSSCSLMKKRSVTESMKIQKRVQKLLGLSEDPLRKSNSKEYRRQAELLLKSKSITAQEPALFQWPFLTLHPTLDLYEALSFEPMHNLSLGVGKMIKCLPAARLTSKELCSVEILNSKGHPRPFAAIRRRVLACANRMLKLVQIESPAARFNVDFSTGKSQGDLDGFYTSDGIVGMLEASDFACLDQVFPFVGALMDHLCGEVGESPTTKVMTLYSDLLAQLYRRGMDPGHTEGSLKELGNIIRDFKDCAREIYGAFQSSGMGTLKFHFLDHVVSDIERIGSPESMSASFFESAHSEVKQHYRATSRRKNTVMEETVGRLGERQALQRTLDREKQSDFSRMVLRLAFGKRLPGQTARPTFSKLETVSGGSAALVKHGKRIQFEEMREFLKISLELGEKGASSHDRHETRTWSLALKDLVSDIGVQGLERFCSILEEKAIKEVSSSLQRHYIKKSLVVERVQSGFVAGMDVPGFESVQDAEGEMKVFIIDNGRRTLKRIVCSHSFYKSGRSRHDCIMIEANAGTLETETEQKQFVEVYFAKAFVLFRVRADYGPFSGEMEEKELVFLRYFDVLPLVHNIDRTLGCIKLKWASSEAYNEESNNPDPCFPWFDIQSVATLRGQVQVIRGDYCLEATKSYGGKDHWTNHWFYVNRFKHDSSEPVYWEEDCR